MRSLESTSSGSKEASPTKGSDNFVCDAQVGPEYKTYLDGVQECQRSDSAQRKITSFVVVFVHTRYTWYPAKLASSREMMSVNAPSITRLE